MTGALSAAPSPCCLSTFGVLSAQSFVLLLFYAAGQVCSHDRVNLYSFTRKQKSGVECAKVGDGAVLRHVKCAELTVYASSRSASRSPARPSKLFMCVFDTPDLRILGSILNLQVSCLSKTAVHCTHGCVCCRRDTARCRGGLSAHLSHACSIFPSSHHFPVLFDVHKPPTAPLFMVVCLLFSPLSGTHFLSQRIHTHSLFLLSLYTFLHSAFCRTPLHFSFDLYPSQ